MGVGHKHPLGVVRDIVGIDRIDDGEQFAGRDDDALFLGPSLASVIPIDLFEFIVVAYGRDGGEIDGFLGQPGTPFGQTTVSLILA